ncbi:MAG TPA: winged helix-turn-helix transcriptional regulator [Thermoplasmata archaeon]|nr:winged helix-turn-helix transcriptional regulator [Thermoplasmata archaeon]
MVDAKDFQIIRSILREPFASFTAIGGPLGLSGVTVKARLERLRRDGAVQVWGVPDPAVFRRHARFFVYGRISRRRLAFALARKSETVVRAAEGHERSFELVTYADTEDAGPPPEFVRRFGDPHFAATMHLSDPKESDCVLSPLDWRVLLPLVRNPRTPVQELASATGLSRKTVRLHREALVRKKLLNVLPFLAGAQAPGFVLYRLFLWMPSTSVGDRQRILGALPGTIFNAWTEEPAGLWLAGAAPTMAHLLRLRDQAERLPGILRVEYDVFLRNEPFPERLEGWIRAELERWETGRRRT